LAHWPRYLGMVQAAINNTPSERLGGRSPNEILFRGSKQMPWYAVFDPEVQTVKKHLMTENIQELLQQMRDDLTRFCESMEEERYGKSVRRRELSKRFSFEIPLNVGDDVLIAEEHPKIGLAPKWAHVGKIEQRLNDWVYKVRDVLTNKVREYHVAKLRPFVDHKFQQTMSNWENVFWQALEIHGIEAITRFRVGKSNQLECFIQWADKHKTPAWENGSVWIRKLPRYVKALVDAKICPEGPVLDKVQGFLQKVGM